MSKSNDRQYATAYILEAAIKSLGFIPCKGVFDQEFRHIQDSDIKLFYHQIFYQYQYDFLIRIDNIDTLRFSIPIELLQNTQKLYNALSENINSALSY